LSRTRAHAVTSGSPMSRRNIYPQPMGSSAFAGIEMPMRVEKFLDREAGVKTQSDPCSGAILVQRFPDFDGQIFYAERFLNKKDMLLQYAVVNDDVGGVPGHEQPFEAGTK